MCRLECRFADWLIGVRIEGALPRMQVCRLVESVRIEGALPRMQVCRLVDRRPDSRCVASNADLHKRVHRGCVTSNADL